ncbi:hypothetical protein [Brachybacterium paraconglomeratum]|uniref:hypothetical protein n=1 Tax=Brachybacterium paraconglomeratum TaxID=173362 RepID=UPI0038217A97
MSDADRTADAAADAGRPVTGAHPSQPDAAQTDAGRSETNGSEAAPQPLTSLSSLLGGSYAGGQACDADGSCD